MGAALGDAAFVQHHDLVGIDHGRQPVRDDERGVLAGDVAERLLDGRLGAAVQRAGRLVEDQDRRVLQQGAGDGDALLLAAGKLQPPLADHRLIAFWQAGDEAMDRRALRRRLDLVLRGALAAIADIVADRVVEQHRVLRNDAKRGTQALLRDLRNVLPVDRDPPALRLVEAEEQARERGLASTRRPDDRGGRARAHFQVDPLQDLAPRLIGEMHVLEADQPGADLQVRRVRHVDHLGRRVDQSEHRLHVDQALPDGAIDHAEQVERAEKLGEQGVHHHHVAGREPPLAPAPDGEAHCACHHQIGDQRLADIEEGEAGLVLHRGVGIAAHRLAVARRLALLGAEIFDRLVVEQAVHRPRHRAGVEVVHFDAQLGPPVGHRAGEADIGRDHHRRRRD